MSRFGLIAKRCKRQDKRKLNCVAKTYIDNHSFVIYTGKYENVYLWCLTNGYWYRLKYNQMSKDIKCKEK